MTTADEKVAHDVRWVAIGDIDRDANHRRKMSPKAWEASIDDLGAQLAAEGMICPIKVCTKADGRLRLVYGLRRLSAAERRAWETVPAIVAGPMTDAEVEAERLSENINRENPSPIDEMVGVNALYDVEFRAICDAQLGAEVDQNDPVVQDELHEMAVRAVAERINRQLRWVRDRLYLRRLSPKVAERVIEGRIPLLHARELARLGDHKAQEQLACYCELDDDGTGGEPLDRLAMSVSRRLTRLEGVAWKLSLPFAGKPACDGCEHNTGSDVLLFEGADAPEQAMCTNPACYEAKRKAAEKAANAAASKVAGLIEKGKLEKAGPKVLEEKGLSPEFVKASTVAARARAKVKTASGSTAKPAASTKASTAPKPTAEVKLESKAYEAWRKFETERHGAEEAALYQLVTEDPLKLWVLVALLVSTSNRYGQNAGAKKKVAAINTRLLNLLQVAKLMPADLEHLTGEILKECFPNPNSLIGMSFWFDGVFESDEVIEALPGIGEMPDQKKWIADWMREHAPAEKPAEPKPAGKKKAAKKKGAKKAAAKKGGR